MYRRILEIHDGAFGPLIIIIFSYNFLTNKLTLHTMRTINQMCVKINMTNEFKKTNSQCDSSIDASCGSDQSQKIKKLSATEKGVVLAGMGINLNAVSINAIKNLVAVKSGANAQNLVREIEGVDAELRYTYEFLANKLSIKVKDHIKAMDVAHDQSQILYENFGTIKYEGKPFYVKAIHAEGSSADQFSVPVSPSMDKSLGYQFFMYRYITGGKAYKKSFELEPTHVVTFKKDGEKSYDMHDVAKLFNYKDVSLSTIHSHIGNNPIRAAFELIKQDSIELSNIIKNLFETHKTQCNVLKHVDAMYKNNIISGVCATKYDSEDQDYFIQYVTCREIFTLASLDDFCVDQKHVDPDWFDEL